MNSHVVEVGSPNAPAVVLLHGFPEFWFGWRHQIAPLADAGFRVLVSDQRGYGLSMAKIVDAPWQLTTWEDFRYKEALGKRPAAMALLHWYTGRMFEKSSYDASVAGTFYRVMHMIDAPWRGFGEPLPAERFQVPSRP